MPQAESFLSVSQKKQKQDCMLTGDFNMISKLSFKKMSTLLGWCSFALLLVFIANIAIGKYMHLKKLSIVSPINGVEEFLLFGLIIILFSCCLSVGGCTLLHLVLHSDHFGFQVLIQSFLCLLYTSPSPRDYAASRMPSSA